MNDRERGAATVWIGVAVSVVLFAVGLTLGLVVLGDDEPTAGGDDDPTSSTSSSESSSESTSESATPDGEQIEGNGYTYPLLEDWNDATDEVGDLGAGAATIDTAVVWGRTLTSGRANMIVELVSLPGDSVDEARENWSEQVGLSVGADYDELDDREIGGEDAVGIRFDRTNENNVDIIQVAYLARFDGTFYGITYTAIDEGDLDAYDEILAGWAWTE